MSLKNPNPISKLDSYCQVMTDQHIMKQRVKSITLAVQEPFLVTSKPHIPVTLILWVHIASANRSTCIMFACSHSTALSNLINYKSAAQNHYSSTYVLQRTCICSEWTATQASTVKDLICCQQQSDDRV